MPLHVDIQTRTISFWLKLVENDNQSKLSVIMYNIIYNFSNERKANILWVNNIKNLLCSLGFSGLWHSQSFLNKLWLVKAINTKIKDTFLQKNGEELSK